MAHLTCVGATRDELAAVLDELADAGIQNVLALRGDPPRGQTTFTPHPDGFRYASELVAFIRSRPSAGASASARPLPRGPRRDARPRRATSRT